MVPLFIFDTNTLQKGWFIGFIFATTVQSFIKVLKHCLSAFDTG